LERINVSELATGKLVGGRYRLESMIGKGGMASVWRAVDQTLDRPVAIKFLFLRDSRRSDDMVPSFLREARIAAAVRHRNVVDILDFGTDEEGVPFMVMEVLEGETVQDRLTRGESFSRAEILTLTVRVLQGLAAVHDAGIVHRDLKPANIFLIHDRSGIYPKLLDFGISRSVQPQSGRQSPVTTKDGHIVGTPEYMSCEQARGLTDIDKRTDIYSMGVIMYELLTGRLPFQAPHTGDLIVQIMTDDPPRVHELRPEVGVPISDLVARAMQRDRELRFPDVEEMRKALIAVAEEDLGPRVAHAMSLPPSSFPVAKDTPGKIRILDGNHTVIGLPGFAAPEPTPMPPRQVAPASTPQEPRRPYPPKALRASRSWVWVAAGSTTAAVVMIGAALGFAYLLPKRQTAATAPRYIVVKSANETPAARESSDAAPTEPVAPSGQTVSDTTASGKPTVADKKEQKNRPQRATRRETPEAKLARAFAEQKANIERCFLRFATELGQGTRLSVRVELNANGKVGKAEVSPANIAGTPLGTCIAQATRVMKFSPQPQPIAFRVPLTARRER
jgi:serine/threonine protein kinase